MVLSVTLSLRDSKCYRIGNLYISWIRCFTAFYYYYYCSRGSEVKWSNRRRPPDELRRKNKCRLGENKRQPQPGNPNELLINGFYLLYKALLNYLLTNTTAIGSISQTHYKGSLINKCWSTEVYTISLVRNNYV